MKSGTIAAIATPQAAGGIGIIRISGEDALSVADRIFVPSDGSLPSESVGYRAHFGKIIRNSKKIDEAICLVFRAPHSYTGEDVAEISLHGGLFLVQAALDAAIDSGARPAEPGEFTKRAFFNGKLDLAEAEAVMGLVSAQGEQSAAAALNALEGTLSREIAAVTDELVAVCAAIAAWTDYPDDDIAAVSSGHLDAVLNAARQKLVLLLSRFDAGRAVTEGVNTAIVGRPNVGKSALMNFLSGFERSIVTPYAGTTRDIVEETVRLGNVVLRLADTAGIRSTDDPVEELGVGLARKRLERAELILAVLDGSQKLTDEDRRLLELCRGKPSVAVINKTDLDLQLSINDIEGFANSVVEISATHGEGLETLVRAVEKTLGTADFDPSAAMLTTQRQRDCCRRAVEILDEAIAALRDGVTLDAVNVSVDRCIDALLELTGKKAGETVVNEVFARFCVGK